MGFGSEALCYSHFLFEGDSSTTQQVWFKRAKRVCTLEDSDRSFRPCYETESIGPGRTLQEHIMGMEALVQQYDSLRAKPFDREVLLGVLMRLCLEGIRQHLTLSISDSTSYQEVRERILAYERSSRLWSVEDTTKSVTNKQNSNTDNMGLAPMEVDAVTYKGKGGKDKGKGKGKNKGGSWSDAWSWASSWFKGGGKKGKSKGKGKGRSKGKSKSKSKGKGKKGKMNPDRCRICNGFGHWGNECPNKDMVREVRTDPGQGNTQTETRIPSSSATAYSSVGSTATSTSQR